MLKTNGLIRLNESDTIAFQSNVGIEAIGTYAGNAWSIRAQASVAGRVEETTVESKKEYAIPAELFSAMDKGDGRFASQLGLIVEEFVAEDLRRINPGVEIRVQL